MTSTYAHVIFFSLVGGLFSLVGGVLLLNSRQSAREISKYATPFAAGALLAAVFLDLLPEGIEHASAYTVLVAALTGIILFFFAERFLHWFHHHHQHHGDPSVSLIIVGDTVHNALDGIAIAAGFLISVPTGIITALAVAAHEIPQEIGDFGLLLAKGMSRKKVLLANVCSALVTTVLAVITFAIGSVDKLPNGVLFGISAGFLLYIAMSDIIPSIHESASNRRAVGVESVLIILGVVVVGISIHFAHNLMTL